MSPGDREHLEADLMRGELSWRALQKKYGIPQATLRDYCERNGIVRNPSGLKRAIVEREMARPADDALPAAQADSAHSAHRAETTHATTTDDRRGEIERAAAEDVRDMKIGLQAARLALSIVGKRLQEALPSKDQYGRDTKGVRYEPKELKTMSEAIQINIATIRSIRGLDFLGFDPRTLSNEQLQDVAAGRLPR